MYSEIVMEHFKNPKNVGELDSPDGVGEVGNPLCGDMMTIHIKVKDDRIDDIRFQTFGCGAAIAVSSMVTEMAKGKTLEEALNIGKKDVAEALGGLPKNKLHCSNLGADALHQAIRNYYDRKSGKPRKEPDRSEKHEHEHEGGCYCPYCDLEVSELEEFCESCGRELDNHS